MIWKLAGDPESANQPLTAMSSAATWDLLTDDLAEAWLRLAGQVNEVRFPRRGTYNTVALELFLRDGSVSGYVGDDDGPWTGEPLVCVRSDLILSEYEQLPDVEADEHGFSDGYEVLMDRVEAALTAAAARSDVVDALRRAEAAGRLRYLYKGDAEDHQLVNGLVMRHHAKAE